MPDHHSVAVALDPRELTRRIKRSGGYSFAGDDVGAVAKRNLFHEPRYGKRHDGEGNGDDEHGLQSVTEGVDDDGASRRGKVADLGRILRDVTTPNSLEQRRWR